MVSNLPSNLLQKLTNAVCHDETEEVLEKRVHPHTLRSLTERENFIWIDVMKGGRCGWLVEETVIAAW